jgi:riboflavin biosynthesis pyrimidine reductase
MPMIDQVFPVKKQVPLEGLYLDQRLANIAQEMGKSIVLTNYVTDKNGVVAKLGKDGHFQIPAEIKNDSDWRLFQELMAQADVIISGGSYFRRLAKNGAQDILYSFEPGSKFEELGQWRLNAGYQKRNPDIAIVTHRMDFELPDELLESDRRILIFTNDSTADSDKARARNNANTTILASGETDVDGERLIATLGNEMGYRVIMMVSGPHVLNLLLNSNRLDLLYVTQVQVEIPFDDPAMVKTISLRGKNVDELVDFRLASEFLQENVVAEDGTRISQFFLRYDRKGLWR